MGHRFNKGRLFNTAINYLEKQSLNITCLILHDVDLLPENDGNLYTCESTYPKHTTSRVRQIGSTRGYNRYYEFLIGGVLMLTFDMYKNLNGFSNLFWGWGGEDDDLSLRLIQRRMCIVRPNFDVAVYSGRPDRRFHLKSWMILDFSALPHPRGQRNNARFGLLTWSTIRLDTDGFAQVEPLTQIVKIQQTSMMLHLKIDADANGSLYKPPFLEKRLSPDSENATKVTTSRKTISTTAETTTTTTSTTITVVVTTTTSTMTATRMKNITTTTAIVKNH